MRRWIQLGLVIILGGITACLPSQYYVGTPSDGDTSNRPSESSGLAEGEICDMQYLTPSALWQRKLQEIRITLTISNYSTVRCKVVGQPKIWIEDQNSFLFTQNQVFSGDSTTNEILWLEPEGENSIQLQIVWRNWCGPIPKDGLLLILMLAENPGKLVTMIQDPSGQPLVETPACQDKNTPSTIEVGSFLPVEP